MVSEKKNHVGFSTRIGFVLAAAGSAVGLGNIWRFPYLAAQYGGGIFLLVYIILAVTFGFSLMITEIAIGRKTGKSVIGAYASISRKFAPLGVDCGCRSDNNISVLLCDRRMGIKVSYGIFDRDRSRCS